MIVVITVPFSRWWCERRSRWLPSPVPPNPLWSCWPRRRNSVEEWMYHLSHTRYSYLIHYMSLRSFLSLSSTVLLTNREVVLILRIGNLEVRECEDGRLGDRRYHLTTETKRRHHWSPDIVNFPIDHLCCQLKGIEIWRGREQLLTLNGRKCKDELDLVVYFPSIYCE